MRERVPDHFCNKDRVSGEGHFAPIYDPTEHRVRMEYRDPEFWERERVKETGKNQEAFNGYMSFLFVGLWITVPLMRLIQPVNVWGFVLIYYGSTVFLAFLRFTLFLSWEKDGRMNGLEELLCAPWRIALATLLWPIFLLNYQRVFRPIGLVQQLRLEAAWRKRNKIWRPLTDDQRHYIEDLWLNGYEEALAELEATTIGRRAPSVCYLMIALLWLAMPTFEAGGSDIYNNQLEVSDSSLIISSRDGPTKPNNPTDRQVNFAEITPPPQLPITIKMPNPMPRSEKEGAEIPLEIDHVPRLWFVLEKIISNQNKQQQGKYHAYHHDPHLDACRANQ